MRSAVLNLRGGGGGRRGEPPPRTLQPSTLVLTFPRPVVFNRKRHSGVGRSAGAPFDSLSSAQSGTYAPTPLERLSRSRNMTVSHQVSEKAATILVVEDDERVRSGLARAFESVGHKVLACGDAAEALRELHRVGCDLVVMDVELPGVSGLALCRLLRAQAATRRLPVIIISSHDREEYKVEAFAAGADDFVVKGPTARELLTRVGAHLESAERERLLRGSNRELSFIADLGRGLLHALSPAEVVRRVAGATYEGANAAMCAAVLLKSDARMRKAAGGDADEGLTVCVFDREGSAEETPSLLNVAR